MDIRPDEVESVKKIGDLHGNDVKLVKTHGGFHLAVGKKKKNSKKTEVLAAGSHQGIVAHQISKEFGADFKPAMFKSEHEALEKVEEKTQYLPSEAIDRGIELFTLSKGGSHEFVLSKRGIALVSYKTEVESGNLIIKSFKMNTNPDEEVANAIAKSMEEKAEELGVETIQKGW